MGAFRFWAPRRGIRTRQGAKLRKREAFSSEAREGRRPEAKAGGEAARDIPHRPPLIWKRSSQGDLFCLGPTQRDSNPQGCGAEETRSVFQRSTRGAKRRSESGRRQPHATSLIAHHLFLLGSQRWGPFFLGTSQRDSNPIGNAPPVSRAVCIGSKNGLRIAQSRRIWHASDPEPVPNGYICSL